MPDAFAPGQVVVERRGKPGGPPALLLPGKKFTADMPPLHLTTRTLLARGWTVAEVWWRGPEEGLEEWARRETAGSRRRTHTVCAGRSTPGPDGGLTIRTPAGPDPLADPAEERLVSAGQQAN